MFVCSSSIEKLNSIQWSRYIYNFQNKLSNWECNPHKKNKGWNWLMYGQLIKTNSSSKCMICRPMQIKWVCRTHKYTEGTKNYCRYYANGAIFRPISVTSVNRFRKMRTCFIQKPNEITCTQSYNWNDLISHTKKNATNSISRIGVVYFGSFVGTKKITHIEWKQNNTKRATVETWILHSAMGRLMWADWFFFNASRATYYTLTEYMFWWIWNSKK